MEVIQLRSEDCVLDLAQCFVLEVQMAKQLDPCVNVHALQAELRALWHIAPADFHESEACVRRKRRECVVFDARTERELVGLVGQVEAPI
eukprot:COSAG01_NODE_33823_length_558_cov_0.555556_2_plen_89_part_01